MFYPTLSSFASLPSLPLYTSRHGRHPITYYTQTTTLLLLQFDVPSTTMVHLALFLLLHLGPLLLLLSSTTSILIYVFFVLRQQKQPPSPQKRWKFFASRLAPSPLLFSLLLLSVLLVVVVVVNGDVSVVVDNGDVSVVVDDNLVDFLLLLLLPHLSLSNVLPASRDIGHERYNHPETST